MISIDKIVMLSASIVIVLCVVALVVMIVRRDKLIRELNRNIWALEHPYPVEPRMRMFRMRMASPAEAADVARIHVRKPTEIT